MKDLIGHRFGRLTVVGKSIEKSTGVRWLCLCECGNEKQIQIRTRKPPQSCGCLQKETARKYHDGIPTAFSQVIGQIQTNAIRRGYEFEISRSEAFKMVTSPCNYCGSEPFSKFKCREYECLYTGIDRTDSNLGYIEGNVVPCCKICNVAKGSMSTNEFLKWVDLVHDFQEKRR